MAKHANTRVGKEASAAMCTPACSQRKRWGHLEGLTNVSRGHSLSICHAECRGECLYQPPETLRTLGGGEASLGMVVVEEEGLVGKKGFTRGKCREMRRALERSGGV